MTIKYTKAQSKVLETLQDYYKYCSSSFIRKEWLETHNRNFNYYYGNQWQDKELLKNLEDIGCDAKTFNHIKPCLHDVISILTRSGKRVGFLPTSDLNAHKKLAEYLKYWAFNVQTQTNHSYFSTLKILSALLGGIGWSNFGYDNGKFFYENVDAREMYPDPDDNSSRYDNSNVICRSYFNNVNTLKSTFPKFSKYFDEQVEVNKDSSHNDIANEDIDYYGLDSNIWVKGKSLRIVEVYYKKVEKYYETVTMLDEVEGQEPDIETEELTLKTFYKEYAEERTADGNIEEKYGTRIYKGVFTDNILLSHGAIGEQVPDQQYFPLLPMVYQRDLRGKPQGIINDIISPQDMINYILSTMLHYTDSKTLIASNLGTDNAKLTNDWELESRKKSGIIFVPDSKDVNIIDNKHNVDHRVRLLQELKSQIQVIMRVYDDFAGKQTNRISGVAINASTMNNINSQNFLTLSHEHMFVSEGRLMLDTIKGVKDLNQVFTYYRNGGDSNGYLDSSISMVNFEVYPQTSANFSSNIEEEKSIFLDIMGSQVKDLFLMSPLFMQEAGVTDINSFKLAEEYKRVIQEQMMMQQGMMQQAQEQQQMQGAQVPEEDINN